MDNELRIENIAISNIEQTHIKNPAGSGQYLLDDLNLYWRDTDLDEFRAMWEIGIPINLIARSFGCEEDEIAVVILHMRRQGKIEPRPGGVYGRVNVNETGTKNQ